MARTKKKADPRIKGKANDNFKGFINHNLSSDEKAEFLKWLGAQEPVLFFDELHRLSENGYQLSIRYDDYSDCHMASLTCRNNADENFGYVMSARAPDSYHAAWLALWKHNVLFGGDWLAFQDREKENGIWG